MRSMSRKARSPGNARCDGLFGTPKGDFIDGREWIGVTFEEFSERHDENIGRHGSAKLKRSLGWKTNGQRRAEPGHAA